MAGHPPSLTVAMFLQWTPDDDYIAAGPSNGWRFIQRNLLSISKFLDKNLFIQNIIMSCLAACGPRVSFLARLTNMYPSEQNTVWRRRRAGYDKCWNIFRMCVSLSLSSLATCSEHQPLKRQRRGGPASSSSSPSRNVPGTTIEWDATTRWMGCPVIII